MPTVTAPVKRRTTLRVFIFDLDDTLVDTTSSLIAPLERRALARMEMAGVAVGNPEAVLADLQRWSVHNPDTIVSKLREVHGLSEDALTLRRDVFDEADPRSLSIEPDVLDLLERIGKRGSIFLLTSGRASYQRAKIAALGIANRFQEIVIVNPASGDTKRDALAGLRERTGVSADSMVCVGNRLDNELAAAAELGMVTVWVRYGEGSGLTPDAGFPAPDHIVDHVCELERVLRISEA